LIIKVKWQKLLIYSGLILLVMTAFFYSQTINYSTTNCSRANYSTTLLNGTALKSNSWTFRIKLWKEYLNQFLDHPIIGHAPQKNYFYENQLYFENEYILYLWRYGIVGFISFIGFYLIPIRKIIKTIRSSETAKNTLLLILVFALCGLTNVPLSNTVLSLLFFSCLGVFHSQKEIL
jgi:O-antigen ligase